MHLERAYCVWSILWLYSACYLLFTFHVSLRYAVISVPCGLVIAVWEGLTSWLSCMWGFVVSRAGYGDWSYQFLIFVFFFTLNNKLFV